jgi:hypothetical protein
MKPKDGVKATTYFGIFPYMNIVTDVNGVSKLYIGWLHVGAVLDFTNND